MMYIHYKAKLNCVYIHYTNEAKLNYVNTQGDNSCSRKHTGRNSCEIIHAPSYLVSLPVYMKYPILEDIFITDKTFYHFNNCLVFTCPCSRLVLEHYLSL